ncbi:PREDICTED: GTP cyclohydrolase 1 feedback regulatory protein-like [Amphimedon queenslandica]|uniref:GTP cyclohydrolase 1 feedback regulatory protein n=1 Tax=Amphimedon queenslandica TaxID=400682 RepID=A0A1X7UW55_AMPQE|nr:PREDICTED: GTP cyclohydrolase 1 feedback regulatory protein-like [Amphimedon queenslandica]|eukprot:XP_003386516.1 PREDICTED: GTP cyclohydrolase 1 feedback regulatory protein-like [Amphimedon queenslandica]
MPQYVLITTQIRLENGPTICGDELSDPVLMAKLDAQLVRDAGNPFQVYSSPHPPRVILNKLACEGFRVVSMAGIGQTCIWTLYLEN